MTDTITSITPTNSNIAALSNWQTTHERLQILVGLRDALTVPKKSPTVDTSSTTTASPTRSINSIETSSHANAKPSIRRPTDETQTEIGWSPEQLEQVQHFMDCIRSIKIPADVTPLRNVVSGENTVRMAEEDRSIAMPSIEENKNQRKL
jgi:hypothetical protein